ncbi:MAG: penicillin-binding protein 2 [Terricaulis sp.]
MKPVGPTPAFKYTEDYDAHAPFSAGEAALARNRIRFLAIGMLVLLLLLAGRAVQLAFSGDPLAEPHRSAVVASTSRADIVDRNGVLLATTVRAYTLTAEPDLVWKAPETADALRQLFPELDRATLIRKLSDQGRRLVFLRRSLTPGQREAVMALGLGGIGFADEERRVYPQGQLAAQALGFTDVDLKPLAGVERGLDDAIRSAGEEGRPVRLSIDVRIQYALESELDAAARATHATGGSAILLDGRTGETLALASWPTFDPNRAGDSQRDDRRDRVAGDLHELGSTIKPFTVAMALQEQRTSPAEVFDLSQPFDVDGSVITDEHTILGPATLREILARSSNIGAARLALRLGEARQTSYLQRLGLLSAASLELGRNQAPLAPAINTRRDLAGRGFGYNLAATQAALAGAYTVFVNNGTRVPPTLVPRNAGDRIVRTQVFTPAVTRQLLLYMRAVVTDGTGRAADVPGLQVAGKTGTAEKLTGDTQVYDQSRNFSSFAGVFPANDPHYVIVLALDDTGAGEQGGAVAAPAIGRILRRIAPMLGLAVEPSATAR